MKKVILSILLVLLMSFSAYAQVYQTDLILTKPDAVWVDSRSYNGLSSLLTAIGSDETTIYIAQQEDFTGTIPDNVRLKFLTGGSINATGPVTINAKFIDAPNVRIFYGSGAYDFASGSELKSAWFEDFDEVVSETSDDEVTIIMSQNETATTNASLGNNVVLKWDSPGNELTISSGIVISNVDKIIAGDYQIVSGDGRFDFNDGVVLKSTWFSALNEVGRHIDDTIVTLEIRDTESISYDYTFSSNITLYFYEDISVGAGKTITIYSPANVVAQPTQQIFSGDGSISFTNGGTVYLEWWGVDGTADEVQINAAISSIPDGLVKFNNKTYTISTSGSIAGKSSVWFEGSGYTSLIYSTGARTAPVMDLDGVTNVKVMSLNFDSNSDSQQYGQLEISGNSSNIEVSGCNFKDGYAGIWINPEENDTIKEILIRNNHLENLSHNIYVGANTGITGETIQCLRIVGNYSKDACSGGDGIKLIQSVYDCTIANNVFEGNDADGIDLFASGDRITITGNIIEGNSIHGIDIKSDLTSYPAATWSEGKRIIIVGNIIRNNTDVGIKIWKTTADEWPRGIVIDGNEISGNGNYGIQCRGHYVTISNNNIFSNCLTGAGDYSAIYVGGISGDPCDAVSIIGNTVYNNGKNGQTNSGILISGYVNQCKIIGNTTNNDTVLSNPYQDYGIYISTTSITNIVMKDNHASGNLTKDVQITSGAGIEITGESVSVRVGTIAAGTDDELPIFSPDSNVVILSAYFINASDITQNDTNYETLTIRDRGADGSATNTICSINTKVTGGVAINDFDAVSMGTPNATHKILTAGDVVSFVKVHGGSGQGLDEAMVQLNYITY